jgi:predicted membrane protein (TIGR00267 family)
MKMTTRQSEKMFLLPSVLGLCDGTLTTLVLAAGRITNRIQAVTFDLAFRIAAVALFSGVFVFFVARYAELRGELISYERQLNLTAHGQLASGALGSAVRREAILAATISSTAAFCGSLVPLLTAALLPNWRWTAIIAALVTLCVMGVALSHVLHGSTIRWSIGLVIGGVVLAILGAYLKIID